MPFYPKKDIEYDFVPHDTAKRDEKTGVVVSVGFTQWIRDGIAAYRRGFPVTTKAIKLNEIPSKPGVTIQNLAVENLSGTSLDFKRFVASEKIVLPKKVVTSPSDVEKGEIWVAQETLKFKENTTSEIIHTVEVQTNKGRANGYVPLDANAKVPLQYLPDIVEVKTNKGRANGYAPLDANAKVALQYLPDIVEVKTNKGQANGYAPLDANGKLPADYLPSAFSGFISVNYTIPANTNFPAGQTTVLQTYDVGDNAHILPLYFVIPRTLDANGILRVGIRFVFHDDTYFTIENSDTANDKVETLETLSESDMFLPSVIHGKSIRKMQVVVTNGSSDDLSGGDSTVTLRAFVVLRSRGAL
jgi:hypothetical protein